jgi:hypothetical protein
VGHMRGKGKYWKKKEREGRKGVKGVVYMTNS